MVTDWGRDRFRLKKKHFFPVFFQLKLCYSEGTDSRKKTAMYLINLVHHQNVDLVSPLVSVHLHIS